MNGSTLWKLLRRGLRKPTRLITAWILTGVAASAVFLFAPPELESKLYALTVGFGCITGFALQLGTVGRRGFLERLSFSAAGAVLIVAVFTILRFSLFTVIH